MEDVINKVRIKVGMRPLPGKTLPGPLALNEDALIAKARQEYMTWLTANPGASLNEKLARFDRIAEVRRMLGRPLD